MITRTLMALLVLMILLIVECSALLVIAKRQDDVGNIAKAKRRYARDIGAKTSRNPMPGGRASKWKRKLSGQWVRR
jgi:hypothetical protein